MEQNSDIHDVFAVFALYGLRKTSMDNVATALSVSRQTLYKKFGTKEELIHWMVSELVKRRIELATQALEDISLPVKQRLLKSFDIRIGQFVEPLRSSPHSNEILSLVDKACKKNYPDSVEKLIAQITEIFLKEKIFPDRQQAEDTAYILQYAAQGLMLSSENRSSYLKNLERVLNRLI